MKAQIKTERRAHPFATLWTNILAGLWAAAAAYILFDSLFITHKNRYAVAAIFPLISAWATLERKRWGRLALMGLSLTTVVVFALLTGLFTHFYHPWQEEALTLGNGATALIVAYGIGTAAAVGLLTLAGVTGFWLCLPHVAEAFNRNKRATLVKAQCAIATVLVCCWGAAIAFAPLMGYDAERNYLRTGPRSVPHSRKTEAPPHANSAPSANSRDTRSAAFASRP